MPDNNPPASVSNDSARSTNAPTAPTAHPPSRVQEQCLLLVRRVQEIQDNAPPLRRLRSIALPPLALPPGGYDGSIADVADFSVHLLKTPWASDHVYQFAEFLYGMGLLNPAREFLERLACHRPDDKTVHESLAVLNHAQALDAERSLDERYDANERAAGHLGRLVLNHPRLTALRDAIMAHKAFLVLERRSQK